MELDSTNKYCCTACCKTSNSSNIIETAVQHCNYTYYTNCGEFEATCYYVNMCNIICNKCNGDKPSFTRYSKNSLH